MFTPIAQLREKQLKFRDLLKVIQLVKDQVENGTQAS